MQNSYQVFARRYRPQQFSSVIGQDAIVKTLSNALSHNKLAHAYLFSGSRGCGKTTLARLLAKAINCEMRDALEPCNQCASCKQISDSSSVDVIEIDGASHRGIDEMRQITETVSYQASVGKTKIYIIDEVHMLTKEAFNALLKTLEEPPPRVKFFFATTEPQRIPVTILSRCQHFALKRPSLEMIVAKLRAIVEQEGIDTEDAVLYRVAQHADGSLRDAETLFDQIVSFEGKKITLEKVLTVLGAPSWDMLFEVDEGIFEERFAVALKLSQQLFSQGKDFFMFIEELIAHFRMLLALQLQEKPEGFAILPKEIQEKLRHYSSKYTSHFLLDALEYLQEKKGQLRTGFAPQITFEVILLHIIRQKSRISLQEIVAQLRELEKRLEKGVVPEKIDFPAATVKNDTPPAPLSPPPKAPVMDELRVDTRDETLMRFAAVELEGTLKRREG